MRALSQAGVSIPGIRGVMEAWPTFNEHTDITNVVAAFNSTYQTIVWLGE